VNSTTQPTATRPWAKAIAHSGTEFAPTPLQVISGAIPQGLRGTLYHNGSARLERAGERIRHWFDGDGAILGVHFTDAGATGVYRYVQTEGYQAEEKAGKFIFGSYDRTPSGSFWQQFSLPVKNTANSGLLALPDRLLALWGVGSPHALDLATLKTFGIEQQLGLEPDAPYSAHPKRDPDTGEIYNFGVSYGPKAMLHLYRSSATGKLLRKAAISLDKQPLIHDFILTQKYLVFFIPPVYLNLLPFLTKFKSFSKSLDWQPDKGTQVLVIDRDTFSVVSRSTTEPWFQWRFGNGCVDADGTVIVTLIRYQAFPQINQFLQEVAAGQTQTAAPGTLWQIRLDPQSAQVIDMRQLLDRGCEYPTIAPTQVGKPWRFTYLSVQRPDAVIGQELPGAIARFDHQTGTLTEANFGENRCSVSPIYAADAEHPDQGWILTEVFDRDRNRSEIWIFDAAYLDAEPTCKLALPYVLPLGFQGIWTSIANFS
jgi:all-trans-8'-apo-beta-carotenal 15,15'-oxygenase